MMATLEERDPAAKLVVPDTPAARRTSAGNPTGCSGHYQGGGFLNTGKWHDRGPSLPVP